MIGLIRPSRPDFVPERVRLNLKRKEKDYIYLMTMNNIAREDIKRMLYIESDRGLKKLRNRVMDKIHNNKVAETQ